MKRKLIDDHKDYFLDNIWAIRMASKEEEMDVARLYYLKGMKENEIAKQLKLPVKKVENLMIRICSRMIIHKAYPRPKEKSRENRKELFQKSQVFYNKHKKTFKKELNQKKYKACVLRYEKEKTLDYIGKQIGVSKERVRQIVCHSQGTVERKLLLEEKEFHKTVNS